jgi:hypothetical protein
VEEYTYMDDTSGKLSEVKAGGTVRAAYTYDTDHQLTQTREYLDSGACKTSIHYYDVMGRISREMSYDSANNEWPTTTYVYRAGREKLDRSLSGKLLQARNRKEQKE